MPTFCRHNRFVERCPICSKTLAGHETSEAPRRARVAASGARSSGERRGRRQRGDGMRVRHEGRAVDDGYSSALVPGLRASADAERLAHELAFSSARLAALALDPPGGYGQVRELAAAGERERATWACVLLAYVSPAEDDEPFAAFDALLAAAPSPSEVPERVGELLDELPLGPRSSHQAGSGTRTLRAYGQWIERWGGAERTQQASFTGDPAWPADRRFARLFERLSLPGFTRAARYELLVALGRLDLYEVRADSLHVASARIAGGEDATALAAKRVFGIGDALLLDRRAEALADAAGVPLEALDLALYNWAAPQRATLGMRPAEQPDAAAIAAALGV